MPGSVGSFDCVAARFARDNFAQDDKSRVGGTLRIYHWAAGPVASSDFYQRRKSLRAFGDAGFTAGIEGASGRQVLQCGNGSFNGLKRARAICLEIGNGPQETARVRMRGPLEDIFYPAHLY